MVKKLKNGNKVESTLVSKLESNSLGLLNTTAESVNDITDAYNVKPTLMKSQSGVKTYAQNEAEKISKQKSSSLGGGIGTGVGAITGSFLGNPILGAQIGNTLGKTIGGFLGKTETCPYGKDDLGNCFDSKLSADNYKRNNRANKIKQKYMKKGGKVMKLQDGGKSTLASNEFMKKPGANLDLSRIRETTLPVNNILYSQLKRLMQSHKQQFPLSQK